MWQFCFIASVLAAYSLSPSHTLSLSHSPTLYLSLSPTPQCHLLLSWLSNKDRQDMPPSRGSEVDSDAGRDSLVLNVAYIASSDLVCARVTVCACVCECVRVEQTVIIMPCPAIIGFNEMPPWTAWKALLLVCLSLCVGVCVCLFRYYIHTAAEALRVCMCCRICVCY